MANKYRCKKCLKNITASGKSPQLRYRKHSEADGKECENSRTIIPAWIVKRGPETDESDKPVIGRDYAPCPECKREPLLDDDGKFMLHVVDPKLSSAERVTCPMSGEPYVSPEGETCSPASDTPAPEPSADTACAAPSTPSAASEPTDSVSSAPPSEAEEMISKWAATARQIENRELPEPTEPSPESTPTQPDSPKRPDAPEAPPSSAPTPATAADTGSAAPSPAGDAADASADASLSSTPRTSETGNASATEPEGAAVPAVAPQEPQSSAEDAAVVAGASTSTVPTGGPPPDIMALAEIFPRSAPTPTAAAAPSTVATLTIPQDAPPWKAEFAQPGWPFSQPAKLPAAVTDPIPMTVLAEQVVARMKEIFYAYDNRRAADNRSAQTTLGPSEVGTPCDRRLALSLMQVPPVNPGGDGWAAFVGTCVHAGLADMFTWADASTGRFAVEVPLTYPNEHVPKGTSDLLDRVLFMVDDHKAQGRWSLDKLKTKGIPPGYRVQLHVYGYGQRLKGERVDYVALISWPRESSNLNDMYAVVEPYDPAVAREAFARVDRIAAEVKAKSEPLHPDGAWSAARPLEVAKEFATADDCRYCPFYASGDPGMTRGCNGPV